MLEVPRPNPVPHQYTLRADGLGDGPHRHRSRSVEGVTGSEFFR